MNNVFGERVIAILKKNNMTQRELSIKLGIDECVLSRYLSGERKPKIETVAEIAAILKTTSDYLIGSESSDEAFYFPKVKRMLARNAQNMTLEEKKELIDALLGGD